MYVRTQVTKQFAFDTFATLTNATPNLGQEKADLAEKGKYVRTRKNTLEQTSLMQQRQIVNTTVRSGVRNT